MTIRLQPADVAHAAEILRAGGTVAFPTETVYGLGANALDATAVAKIFAAKERPGWDPIIVHISDRGMLDRVAQVPAALAAKVTALAEAFWPGPLTLLLPRHPQLPLPVTAGRPLVGVRVPRHPLALDLIRAAGLPIAAPSANRFGRISPTTAAHVLEDLDGRIDAVLDGGPTQVGVESTVIDVTAEPMILYRPGAVTAEQIAAVAGQVTIHEPKITTETPPESLPSPGVGIRHYAPRARLLLVTTEAELNQLAAIERKAGKRVGVLLPEGWQIPVAASGVGWGSLDQPENLARALFASLRELDATGVDTILVPLPQGEGIARAIRDRLKKAALSVAKG